MLIFLREREIETSHITVFHREYPVVEQLRQYYIVLTQPGWLKLKNLSRIEIDAALKIPFPGFVHRNEYPVGFSWSSSHGMILDDGVLRSHTNIMRIFLRKIGRTKIVIIILKFRLAYHLHRIIE